MIDIQPVLFGDNYNFFVHSGGPDFAVIDLSNGAALTRELKSRKITPTHLFLTHHHFDHIDGITDFVKTFPKIQVYKPKGEDRIPVAGIEVDNEVQLTFGDIQVRVLTTHAHTKHCAAYLFDETDFFVGDALFQGGCGRLFEGSVYDLEEAMDLFLSLSPETKLYFGHEYGLTNLRFARHLEPTNQQVHKALQKLEALQDHEECALPVFLEEELQTNPFLRVDEPELCNILDPDAQLQRHERLYQLRIRRDHF